MLDIFEKMHIITMFQIEDLCNGSTPDSDSVCGGSNPSSSAKKADTHLGICFFYCCGGGCEALRQQHSSDFLFCCAGNTMYVKFLRLHISLQKIADPPEWENGKKTSNFVMDIIDKMETIPHNKTTNI